MVEILLRLGFGRWLVDTPRNRELITSLGLSGEVFRRVAPRLRSRADWLRAWEAIAGEHLQTAEAAWRADDRPRALDEIHQSFMAWAVAVSGDGYYFHTPIEVRAAARERMVPLFDQWRAITGALSQRVSLNYQHGQTSARLTLPAGHQSAPGRTLPALVTLHPLGDDKDTFDFILAPFRDAGYATLTIDLPAHGDNQNGPRLRPDSEDVALAGLEWLAQHPAINPARIGLLGCSLGGYIALRAAARGRHAKVCVSYAAPFDLEVTGPVSSPGAVRTFAHMVGASSDAEIVSLGSDFHLNGILDQICIPVCILHGTQDQVCHFSITYSIASHIRHAPVTVIPLADVGHEAAYPLACHLAAPAIDWLHDHL